MKLIDERIQSAWRFFPCVFTKTPEIVGWSNEISCRILSTSLLTVFLFLFLPQAYADEQFKFANIICAPDILYARGE